MPIDNLDVAAAAGRLQVLVATGRYAEASGLLEECGRALDRMVRELQPGDPCGAELVAEWRRILEDLRRRVLAGRSHLAARLAGLPKLGGYVPEPWHRRTFELIG